MNRRDLLKGAAVAPLAMLPISSAIAADRSDWNKAVARFNATKEEAERIYARFRVLNDAAEAACPRREEFFRVYDMAATWDRKRNANQAYRAILLNRLKDRAVLTEAEVPAIRAEADRIAAELEEWVARRKEVYRESNIWEDRYDKAADEHYNAREALLAAEAPDQPALLLKIEVLAAYLEEAEGEDSERINHVRSDARRLLSHGRA